MLQGEDKADKSSPPLLPTDLAILPVDTQMCFYDVCYVILNLLIRFSTVFFFLRLV